MSLRHVAVCACTHVTGALATTFTLGFVTTTSDGNAFNETVILGSASLTHAARAELGGDADDGRDGRRHGSRLAAEVVGSHRARPAHGDDARAIGFLTVAFAFAYNMVLTPFGRTTLNRGGLPQRQETGLR
ncbi:hypothetical protein OG780_13380 [Streptomyces sp. NBC_00386]|uniref:hypothetical protein n=1 Tax=Streptomyces sp. NBC_00386 TaxID=2975734 RepID=UPI002E1A6153